MATAEISDQPFPVFLWMLENGGENVSSLVKEFLLLGAVQNLFDLLEIRFLVHFHPQPVLSLKQSMVLLFLVLKGGPVAIHRRGNLDSASSFPRLSACLLREMPRSHFRRALSMSY